jgi:hypothetical protein
VIADDVAALVNVARSVGPGYHGSDGSEAHAVCSNEAQDIIGGPTRRVVVIWLLVIELGHCLHGVSKGRLRDVWVIRRVATSRKPSRTARARAPPCRLTGITPPIWWRVDDDIIGHLHLLRGTIIPPSFAVQVDGTDTVSLTLGRGRLRVMNNSVRVGPGHCAQGCNQPTVCHSALNGIAALSDTILSQMAPRAVGRSPYLLGGTSESGH